MIMLTDEDTDKGIVVVDHPPDLIKHAMNQLSALREPLAKQTVTVDLQQLCEVEPVYIKIENCS